MADRLDDIPIPAATGLVLEALRGHALRSVVEGEPSIAFDVEVAPTAADRPRPDGGDIRKMTLAEIEPVGPCACAGPQAGPVRLRGRFTTIRTFAGECPATPG